MAISTNSIANSAYSSYATANSTKKTEDKIKDTKAELSKEPKGIEKTTSYGKTIGDAKLSKEGAEYYEKLKKQYGNMDFILVSKDQKASVMANSARYASPNKTVVLIDEEKIERMATDENYRKKYEGIIKDAASGLSQLKAQMESSGLGKNVLGYGMKVDDGGNASFFAVMKKSSDSQKAMIEKKAEKKKAEKKANEKKAEKKQKQEKLEEARTEKAKASKVKKDDTVTFEANTMEELAQKISEYSFISMSNNVETESETKIGHNIDFRG